MTAVCGGGPSEVKPGIQPLIVLSASAVAEFLASKGMPWAYVIGAALGNLTFALNDLCTVDPPAVPAITASDVLAVFTLGDTQAHILALQKFSTLVGAFLWYDMCECAANPQPAPPAPVPNPTGVAIDPPQAGSPISAVACHDQVTAGGIDNGGPFEYANWLWHGNPSNLTSIRVTIHQPRTAAGTVQPMTWRIIETGDSAIGVKYDKTLPLSFDQQVVLPIAAGATELRIQGTSNFATTETMTIEIEGFCGGALPDSLPSAGCCPPDATVAVLLNQILETVTLIQRQRVPFAYVPGTRHNGLTGMGQISVSGLLGVSVIVTTLPPELGHYAGDPPELFDVGFVTTGTADGWHRSYRIDHSPLLVMPIEASDTLVGYTLAPNVVVDLVELVREP